MTPLLRFEGGRRLARVSGAVGAVGLLATLVGGLLGGPGSAREVLFNYLFAYAYWLGLAAGALLLLATFHATGARWAVVLRRALELMAGSLPLFVLLFVPVALGMRELYLWMRPTPELGEHALHLLAHKRPYLNAPFFLVRAGLCLAAWWAVGALLLRWSRRQDREGDLRLLVWQRRLATGALPLLGISLSFAVQDWLMSLEPLWESSVYALYVLSGAYAGALALLALAAVAAGGESGALGALVGETHLLRLGTLLFAMLCFWAYLGFSQYLLIWIASLPREVPWYVARQAGGWGTLAVAIGLLHFVLPFFLLLSRGLKRRRGGLAAVALLVLFAHALDTYWLVLPALHPAGAHFHWSSLSAFVGVGGLALAWTLWRARGDYAVPVKDPYLFHSLHASKP
ncbi:hypothetical protein FGE12_29115 [Aggregicoccus sp. 17bor-14]|uniref:hypothetical protein n=1 Tax=Myxococcaceae TaxID=31 RepID=UPI00129CFC82|nr:MULTISPECIES: hypothetical protein [Myxococcaceae]MBF5046511.1 hypothetical protein [Simulacricoccus sp. 17bor-14]MRI92226.1 hypothetical protein [Aggregicoccus sp. 17bor-14]